MSADREDRERRLVCKGCGATGTAEYSENNYMYQSRPDRLVFHVDGPFDIIDHDMLKFKCTTCGRETEGQ